MAKRFLDSNTFSDKFIRKLTPAHKLFWVYLITNCDHAGIWAVELDVAAIRCGFELEEAKIIESFGDRIIILEGGEKWFIPKFIKYQYKVLTTNNKLHISVYKVLESNNLLQYIEYRHPEEGEEPTVKAMRKRLTSAAKDLIKIRDKFRCQYCGFNEDENLLVIDHIVSLDAGGNNEDYNLICACVTCNSQKKNLDVFEFMERFKGNSFLQGAYKKIEAACSLFQAAKDKVKDKVKEEVKVKDKDKDKDKVILPWKTENFEVAWDGWKKFKKTQHRFTYKTAETEQAAIERLVEIAEKSESEAIEIIKYSIAQGYQGLYKEKNNGSTKKQTTLGGHHGYKEGLDYSQ